MGTGAAERKLLRSADAWVETYERIEAAGFPTVDAKASPFGPANLYGTLAIQSGTLFDAATAYGLPAKTLAALRKRLESPAADWPRTKAAVVKLLTPPKARTKRGAPSTADRDDQLLAEWETGQWPSVAAMAKAKRMKPDTLRAAIRRTR